MKRLLSSLLIILLLTNCIGTSYQKLGTWKFPPGGYSDSHRGDNIYYIEFRGNGFTPLDTVKDYALLRSAEVTKENNFLYFKVDSSETKYIQLHGRSCSNGICTPIVTNLPRSYNVISCFKEKPKNKEDIYDANFIVEGMKLKYKM